MRLARPQNPGVPSPSRPGTGPRRRSNFCARWRAPGLSGTGMGATRCAPGGHCSSGLVGMLFGAGRWPLGVCSPRTESAILPFPDSSPNLGGHGHSGACGQEHQTQNRGPTLCHSYLFSLVFRGRIAHRQKSPFSCPVALPPAVSAADSLPTPGVEPSRVRTPQPLLSLGFWEPEGSSVETL